MSQGKSKCKILFYVGLMLNELDKVGWAKSKDKNSILYIVDFLAK